MVMIVVVVVMVWWWDRSLQRRGMSGLWRQVHSLEETVLISYRTFMTFLSFYNGRTCPNGFSRVELRQVLECKHMFPY
ncbi:hypothetical protein X777_02470 [Ooceraea biroi]|uniref:Secreted protein n=1 Tax=Ooceraea biroi TaxID=2015173 RepID=A0A026WN16_OOCBI|nr:hypothetical protein X777_02470 [Ooceraea biroi]